MLAWVGNFFIVLGLWQIGNKKRYAFILSLLGESAWVGYAMVIRMYSLAFICLIFAVLALRNYIKWGET
jgi:hypothetical protein